MQDKIGQKNILSILIYFSVALFIFFPFFISAQSATPNTGIVYECVTVNSSGQNVYGDCQYNDLISAVKKVIDWLIIFTLEFSVVVFIWAGFNYMISGDNPGKRREANEMLRKVVIGIFFVLASWLVINLIANTLLTQTVIDVTPVGP